MKNKGKGKVKLLFALIMLLCVGLGYWVFFGQKKETNSDDKGLNITLPDANLKKKDPANKLGFYELAQQDSLKKEEWLRNDPYFRRDTSFNNPFRNELTPNETMATSLRYKERLNTSPYEKNGSQPEEMLLHKLKQLEKSLSNNEPVVSRDGDNSNGDLQEQINRLEQLIKMSTGNAAEDPAMTQLEGTLDKILDIQHPTRVSEREVQERSKRNPGVPVIQGYRGDDTLVKGFYGYSSAAEYEPVEVSAIEAVVHRDQSLVDGGIVQLRLVNEVFINGKRIAPGLLVSGKVKLDGERLQVDINSIRNKREVIPVKLCVYDLDGLPGIYIPGAINRETAKQAADNSLGLIDISSADPSLKSKVMQTGVEAAKNLFSKKAKLVKVNVKANYSVLLK